MLSEKSHLFLLISSSFIASVVLVSILFKFSKSQKIEKQNAVAETVSDADSDENNNLAAAQTPKARTKTPISVNYHFTRKCNYTCGFCFHTAKTSHKLSLEEAKRGLRKLKDAGMRKINFAGGEPFLYPSFLGDLVKFCKSELKLESVSIISNGSKIKAEWLEEFAPYLDILGISCDSFVEEINVKIGRGTGKHIENIFKVRELCHDYNIKFKLNTVVCKHNYMEDMNDYIKRLEPFRWKCFQVLVVKTENDGVSSQAIRDATEFLISKEQYEMFCEKHKNQPSFIKESNELMRSSYLILDEYMRFLDKGDDEKYVISESILNVDVEQALSQIKWDERSFHDRNGEYDWSRDNIDLADPAGAGDSICSDKKLEW